MKKFVIIGVFISLFVASIGAQENKKFSFPKLGTEPYTWNVFGPTQSLNGSLAHLEIFTYHKISDITFNLGFYLQNGEKIEVSKNNILKSGSRKIQNDILEFASDSIWQTLYIVSIPDFNAWEVKNVSFSGQFLTKEHWNIINKNILAYHSKGTQLTQKKSFYILYEGFFITRPTQNNLSNFLIIYTRFIYISPPDDFLKFFLENIVLIVDF